MHVSEIVCAIGHLMRTDLRTDRTPVYDTNTLGSHEKLDRLEDVHPCAPSRCGKLLGRHRHRTAKIRHDIDLPAYSHFCAVKTSTSLTDDPIWSISRPLQRGTYHQTIRCLTRYQTTAAHKQTFTIVSEQLPFYAVSTLR